MKRILALLLLLLPLVIPYAQNELFAHTGGEPTCIAESVDHADGGQCAGVNADCEQAHCSTPFRPPLAFMVPAWPPAEYAVFLFGHDAAPLPGFPALPDHPPQA